MATCEKCGAVMGDVAKHDQWHMDVDGIESTALDAQEKADWASNVLYQNNISI